MAPTLTSNTKVSPKSSGKSAVYGGGGFFGLDFSKVKVDANYVPGPIYTAEEEAALEAELAAVFEFESESQLEPQPEPQPEPQSKPQPVPQPVPVAKPVPQPAPQPAPKPAPQPVPQQEETDQAYRTVPLELTGIASPKLGGGKFDLGTSYLKQASSVPAPPAMNRQSSKPWEDQEMLYKVHDTLSHIQYPFAAPTVPAPAPSGISCVNMYSGAPPAPAPAAAPAPPPYTPGPPPPQHDEEDDYEFVPVRQRRNQFNKADYMPQERKPIKPQRPPPRFAPAPTPPAAPKPMTPVHFAAPMTPCAPSPAPFRPAEGEVVQPETPAWAGTLSSAGGPKPWDAGVKPSHVSKPARSVSPQKKAAAPPSSGEFRPTQTKVIDFSNQPDDGPRVMHLQYNSPLDMYSKENVEETLHGQTQAALGGGNTVQKKKPQIASFLPSPGEMIGSGLKQAPPVPPKKAPKPPPKPAPKPGSVDESKKTSAITVDLSAPKWDPRAGLKPVSKNAPRLRSRPKSDSAIDADRFETTSAEFGEESPSPVPEWATEPIRESRVYQFEMRPAELGETALNQAPEESPSPEPKSVPEPILESNSEPIRDSTTETPGPVDEFEKVSAEFGEAARNQAPEEPPRSEPESAPEPVTKMDSKPISDSAPKKDPVLIAKSEPVKQAITSKTPAAVVAPPKPSESVPKASEKALPRSPISPTSTAQVKEGASEGSESEDIGLTSWFIPLALFILLGAVIVAFFLYRQQESVPSADDLITATEEMITPGPGED